MYSVPNEIAAAARARWLAEVYAALEEVLGLLPHFILVGGRTDDSVELYVRVEALRSEVMRLRSCHSNLQLGPERMCFEPEPVGEKFG